MFIREVKTLIDFADQIQDLTVLLSDPRKIKALSKEYEKALEVIAKRDDVLKDIAKNEKLLSDVEKGKAEIEAAKKLAADNLAQSESIKAAAEEVMKSADMASKEADEKLKNAIALEAKNATIVKKSADKALLLEKKMADNEAKSAILDDSITRYNDAVSKLSSVRVG